MPRLRNLRLLVGAALLVVDVAGDGRSARAGEHGWQLERTTPHPGVEITTMRRAQPPLVVHAVRISPDASVALRPVLASSAVGDETADRGHETTSSMCSRASGIVCVNADFNACPGCREPFGGVVRDGRVLRSFNVHHEQLSVGERGLTTERIQWSGVLRASYAWQHRDLAATGLPIAPGRAFTSSLDLAGLNVRIGPDEVVAYTSEWAPAAPAPRGATHLSLVLSGALVPGSLAVVSAERVSTSPIPANGVVVVASGAAAERLDRFWEEWVTTDADERALVVETATSQPIETSVGGHPVLLRDGQVLALNQRDPKVHDRHPRTLAGWTSGGDLLLLIVDGRQPGYSQGITLVEAQGLLLSLGVSNGINLDGGGSSTFVETCGSGRCVRNRPSDGHERRVTSALAVVAAGGTAATTAPDQLLSPAAAAPVPTSAPSARVPEPAMAPAVAAPPSPPPITGTPPAVVVTDVPVVAAAPTEDVVAVVSLPSAAAAAPAPRAGSPPAPPLVPLEVGALGLWLAAVACTALASQRWARHR
ncbi:MAG: phosphodiester glycosidase family protein [Actinomycetota bacterium]|nr:phosphodiester glycosidase family protein [Actinomycetota bacterium]